MTQYIERLLAAGSALLVAEERLAAEMPEQAERAHAQATQILAAARDAIVAALASPGDAWDRLGLLHAAIDADGLDSPLVARAAAALAEAASAGAAVAA